MARVAAAQWALRMLTLVPLPTRRAKRVLSVTFLRRLALHRAPAARLATMQRMQAVTTSFLPRPPAAARSAQGSAKCPAHHLMPMDLNTNSFPPNYADSRKAATFVAPVTPKGKKSVSTGRVHQNHCRSKTPSASIVSDACCGRLKDLYIC